MQTCTLMFMCLSVNQRKGSIDFCLPGRRPRAQYSSPAVRNLAGFAGSRHTVPGSVRISRDIVGYDSWPYLKGKLSAAVLLASATPLSPCLSASGLEGGREVEAELEQQPWSGEKGAAVDWCSWPS